MRKVSIFLMTVFLVGVLMAQTLVVKGSNTVYPIAQLWLEEFSKMYPQVKVTLEGAGSTTGIKALLDGTADVANASRFLKKSEIDAMMNAGKYFVPIVVAYDGIAAIVNPKLQLDSISLETLKKIYTGEITQWNQVDPKLPNKRIVVYSRNTASGTFETWLERVLHGAKMAAHVQFVESTQAEIESVANNEYAIAYTGLGYITSKVKPLKVEGVTPTVENVLNGTYPISRPLYVFIDLSKYGYSWPEKGIVADYIRFILSPEGQKLVEKAGYVPAYGTSK